MAALTAIPGKKGLRPLTFEDLKGLRAEGYIRDSTRDQRDGFGPEMQRRGVEGFAGTYGLVLGSAWYTDFITGTSTLKRSGFRQALQDAGLDRLDVLLVYHTSRFARNRADAIRYKAELRNLGKVLVFVSQGIISGNDNDFLNEGINEVLDEHYSRSLSRWVADGLRVKHENGIANGVPPLGYRSEKLDNGKRERKVPDPEAMPALLDLLRCYASGRHSYQTLADHLNALGYRTRNGRPFTVGSIEQVLVNRFYEGKAVYHPGKADEVVRDGTHEVPQEVKELWLRCQEVKRSRSKKAAGRPREERRAYPFARLTECGGCGQPYGAKTNRLYRGEEVRRLVHGRHFCHLKPHSVRVERLVAQFQEGVLPYVALDNEWKRAIQQALSQDGDNPQDHRGRAARLERALSNLRKQHLWGDLSDEEYRRERQDLERRLKALEPTPAAIHLPNLERAAQLLHDLSSLWVHPGVTDSQREELLREVLQRAIVVGEYLAAIEPKEFYKPLFAYFVTQPVRNSLPKPTRPDHFTSPGGG